MNLNLLTPAALAFIFADLYDSDEPDGDAILRVQDALIGLVGREETAKLTANARERYDAIVRSINA